MDGFEIVPCPRVSPALLARCAGLAYCVYRSPRPGDPLGVFSDGPLYLVADRPQGEGRVAWALDEPLPVALHNPIPFAFSRHTYHVLHEGTPAEGGTILWERRRYRIAAAVESGRAVAVAIVVKTQEPSHPDPKTPVDTLRIRKLAGLLRDQLEGGNIPSSAAALRGLLADGVGLLVQAADELDTHRGSLRVLADALGEDPATPRRTP